MRPKTLHAVSLHILAGIPLPSAVKEFIDEFQYAPAESMVLREPDLTGDPVSDAFLGGLAEYIGFRLQIPVPEWALQPSRFLEKPIFMGGRYSHSYMLVKTPFSFRRRNLFCGEVSL